MSAAFEDVPAGAALTPRETATQFVANFERAAEKVRQGFALLVEATEICGVGVRGSSRYDRDSFDDPEKVIKHMERETWELLAAKIELGRFMSIKRWREFQEQLARGELPPITVDAVMSFGEGLRAQISEMHREAIVEIHDWLRPREYDHVHRLKTNTELEIGPKVILSYTVERNWNDCGFHVSYGGDRSQRLLALERVLDALDGKGMVSKGHVSELEAAIKVAPEGETRLFRYRCCKNQNLHLSFRRLDLLASFNAIAGGKTLKPEKGNKSPRSTRANRPAPDARTGEQRSGKELAFFATPPALARRMALLAEIRIGDVVLEPSAGGGAILTAIRDLGVGPVIRCVEVHPGRAEELREKFDAVVEEADFLSLGGEIGGYSAFDAVIANPPWNARSDVRHAAAMLRWLRPGGALVAVLSASAMTRTDAEAVEFKRDMGERGGHLEWLPRGAFKAAGTSANACLCIVPRRNPA